MNDHQPGICKPRRGERDIKYCNQSMRQQGVAAFLIEYRGRKICEQISYLLLPGDPATFNLQYHLLELTQVAHTVINLGTSHSGTLNSLRLLSGLKFISDDRIGDSIPSVQI